MGDVLPAWMHEHGQYLKYENAALSAAAAVGQSDRESPLDGVKSAVSFNLDLALLAVPCLQ
jgi:hypothetical protein